MYRKEVDCGSWGWYFDDDSKLLSNVPEFLRAMMMISLQYGINLSPLGVARGATSYQDIDQVLEEVLKSVEGLEGNLLQKAIGMNFYSTELSSKVMPSIVYIKEDQVIRKSLYNDLYSVFFCTLRKEKLHSIFYNLRSDLFMQEDNADVLIYANTTRFNSYIHNLHQLMKKFNASLFDCTAPEINPSFRLNEEGYIVYENEYLFYEDVKDLLPNELNYMPTKTIDTSFS